MVLVVFKYISSNGDNNYVRYMPDSIVNNTYNCLLKMDY